ncbi:hypothetical protein GCM10027170_00030 [Aliiglaciecola aliphaticivorans]
MGVYVIAMGVSIMVADVEINMGVSITDDMGVSITDVEISMGVSITDANINMGVLIRRGLYSQRM